MKELADEKYKRKKISRAIIRGCVSAMFGRYSDLNSQVDSLKRVIETQSDEITTLETYLVN